MSNIIEQITNALQTIEYVRNDIKSAYRVATELECIALDAAMLDVCDARNKLDRLLRALESKE